MGTRDPAREARIVELSKSGDWRLAEIGKMYGITRERVRQILKRNGVINKAKPKPLLTVCNFCGEEFDRRGRNAKKVPYCSRECGYRSMRRPESAASNYYVRHLVCNGCGIEFTRSGHINYIHDWAGCKNNYCSKQCYWENGTAREGTKYEAFGESKTLSAWAEDERCQVSRNALKRRLKDGMPPETAILMPPMGIFGNGLNNYEAAMMAYIKSQEANPSSGVPTAHDKAQAADADAR